MNTLSLPKAVEKAPAVASRRSAAAEKLIDSNAFLRHVRKAYGMNSIGVAVQGKRHDDSKKAKARDGRHLVAASRSEDGLTFFLLNSHFKDRRAHIGLGVQRDGNFLIGPSMAVQRWKGFAYPVEGLANRFADVVRVVKALERLRLTPDDILLFAKTMAKRGYMPTVEARPAARALIDGLSSDKALDVGFYVIGRMRAGNLQASTRNGRRIKKIRRPDGLFHAGLVAFDWLMGRAYSHYAVPMPGGFGRLKDRLIRP